MLDGRYRVDSLIAQGGMSTVYRGLDLRLDRRVAIKVMRAEFATDPSFLTRFEREARAAAGLGHPGVVAMFDQGRDGDSVFLVMELVDGGTLRDLLRQQGPLTVPVTLSILEPVLSALAAAHEAGLVHRDVKPENVLISGKGEVKVADFGLVRAISSTTMATGNVILGTVAYLSPEQVSTGYADARSDVYSAGILAFEMLTGAPPYDGDNPISVAYQHVHSDCPPPSSRAPGVPEALDQILVAATSRNADQRPINAGAFLAELVRARARLNIRRVAVPVPAPATSVGRSGTRVLAAERPVADLDTDLVTAEHLREMDDVFDPEMLRRRRRRRTTLIAVVLVILLACAAAVAGWWLGSGRWTAVPALIGVTQESAVQSAEAADLVPVVSSRHHNSTPAGRVSAVDPVPGQRQLRGSTIAIVVSTGRPVVPAITPGATTDAALAALQAADLKGAVDPASAVFDPVIGNGLVVGTDPASGASLDIGSTVALIVSKGTAPVTVPSVVDKSAEDAGNALKVAGLVLGEQIGQFDGKRAAGTVIGTLPASGQQVGGGSTVQLVVSNSLRVPPIAGESQSAAAGALSAAGLKMTVGEQKFSADIDGGKVIGSTPAAGALVDPANPAVTVTISTAVTMPDTVGRNLDEVATELTSAGLDVQVSSFWGFGDNVRSQAPDVGTRVAPGSTVSISSLP